MRAIIEPGGPLEGSTPVPGDKSIAHRWLMLAATAEGSSRLAGLPPSLDVRATAACLAGVSGRARPTLEAWSRDVPKQPQGHGFTWDSRDRDLDVPPLEVEGEGRSGLVEATSALECANSGTTMRLLAGLLAAAPFETVLRGDASLMQRPMERVAAPLREMGARIETQDGHAPLRIRGGNLRGRRVNLPAPSAQVKSAILLAGLAASGSTVVTEPARTRDHTERALAALGAPLTIAGAGAGARIEVRAFQHPGFEASVPGDISSAAFLVAAAALTGSELAIADVGLNPTRSHFLEVMRRMGIETRTTVLEERLGEPVGEMHVSPSPALRPTRISADELPLVIDEVPVLSLVAAHAPGDTWFMEAGELRVKESDRLASVVEGITALGGHAAVEGEDLVVAGGGLTGGRAHARGDHRMAMAFAVAALAARAPVEIEGMEAADVSFPGFVAVLAGLGARIRMGG